MRGITLAEISESTKISKRWLQALEEEDFTLLPGGVFNRGFVRAYAHFLGINEEEAVADYIGASNEQPPPEDQFPLEIHEKPDSPPLNSRRSVLPVLCAVLALILGAGGWMLWIKHRPQESAVVKRPSTASAALPPAQTQATSVSLASGYGSNLAGSNQESRDVAPHSRQSSRPPVDDGRGPISVVIKARKDSWISIAADGQPASEFTLTANNERSVTADRELVLKTGNAGGIEVSYNGKTLGTLGKDRQVRTLTFNTAGLQQ
jgi:cytoskeleton protein RodZ